MRQTHRTPILSASDMQACDSHTITDLDIPSQVLMERAARAVAEFLLNRRDLFPYGRVLFLCGSGNNGGDGFAAARFLADGSLGERREVCIIYTGATHEGQPDEGAMSEECARQYRMARTAEIDIGTVETIDNALSDAACVVDAIFGIGLHRAIEGREYAAIQAASASGLPVLAVDIPSGVHTDTGRVLGTALPATATVTMQALKTGLILYPGADLCGEIAVADIGIDLSPATPPFYAADNALLRDTLLPRKRRSHKGTFGRVALLGGSVGMAGAAILCARAALRSGVGLCEMIIPTENRSILQISVPEAIVNVYDGYTLTIGTSCPTAASSRATLRQTVRTSATRASAIVAGCGLGTGDAARIALNALLSVTSDDRSIPLVLDADALNLLAEDASLWEAAAFTSPKRQIVITPHPTEMARLCGRPVSEILMDLPGIALAFAQQHGIHVVLKDAHTVIASPHGEVFLCIAGNAGMATGGSGDALAGVIGAILAQKTAQGARDGGLDASAMTAAIASAVYLHAAAGDRAAEELGEIGMLPSDLIERLPLVTKSLSDSRTRVTTA